MTGDIVICLDGSELGESILPLAADIAGWSGSKIVLLHVIETPFKPRGLGRLEVVVKHPDNISEPETSAEVYLEQVAGPLRERGLDVESVTIEGTVTDSILAYVGAHPPALITMAGHGRRGLDRVLSGSITETVLRKSGLPVLALCPEHGPGA